MKIRNPHSHPHSTDLEIQKQHSTDAVFAQLRHIPRCMFPMAKSFIPVLINEAWQPLRCGGMFNVALSEIH